MAATEPDAKAVVAPSPFNSNVPIIHSHFLPYYYYFLHFLFLFFVFLSFSLTVLLISGAASPYLASPAARALYSIQQRETPSIVQHEQNAVNEKIHTNTLRTRIDNRLRLMIIDNR